MSLISSWHAGAVHQEEINGQRNVDDLRILPDSSFEVRPQFTVRTRSQSETRRNSRVVANYKGTDRAFAGPAASSLDVGVVCRISASICILFEHSAIKGTTGLTPTLYLPDFTFRS
ncbi:hypothetical protein AMATHDRAFT_7973 [Amanita thiersii Skay4041]|uniref:Uncharacterized protein n=1 Tax=Amanita thiersii Skay4041 TaxID=703135 RepID=A0A2A9NF17_9AGAR|nr:hypothetical protein AMATHDRAFT_7973 [Amanita thiersii Skay4041]